MQNATIAPLLTLVFSLSMAGYFAWRFQHALRSGVFTARGREVDMRSDPLRFWGLALLYCLGLLALTALSVSSTLRLLGLGDGAAMPDV